MEVEAVAREALARGSVEAAIRSTFAPSEAKALAIDAHDGVAAVLAVRRRRDDAWIVDVVRFVDEDGVWIDLGSGGGTWGDLPVDWDAATTPSLGPNVTGWSSLGDEGLVTAGGFVIGAVDAVEVVVGDRTRRVAITAGSSAFVVAVAVEDDRHWEEVDVRALDQNGAVIDSTAAWGREREAAQPGITVAQALALPDGSSAIVRGVLLALPGEPPMLCDDIDDGPPPRCRGARLRIDTGASFPPTVVEDGAVSTVMLVVSGVVRGGVLTPAD